MNFFNTFQAATSSSSIKKAKKQYPVKNNNSLEKNTKLNEKENNLLNQIKQLLNDNIKLKDEINKLLNENSKLRDKMDKMDKIKIKKPKMKSNQADKYIQLRDSDLSAKDMRV
jgi:hypothetical protein